MNAIDLPAQTEDEVTQALNRMMGRLSANDEAFAFDVWLIKGWIMRLTKQAEAENQQLRRQLTEANIGLGVLNELRVIEDRIPWDDPAKLPGTPKLTDAVNAVVTRYFAQKQQLAERDALRTETADLWKFYDTMRSFDFQNEAKDGLFAQEDPTEWAEFSALLDTLNEGFEKRQEVQS